MQTRLTSWLNLIYSGQVFFLVYEQGGTRQIILLKVQKIMLLLALITAGMGRTQKNLEIMEIRDYLEKSGKRNEIQGKFSKNLLTFSRRRRYHIETSPLICGPNQWTSFYMITASVLKGLNQGNSGKGLRNLSKQIFQHCHLLVFDISPSAFLCVHNLFLYV